MFTTFKSRLLLGLYVFIVLSIPVGAYLVSQNQTTKSNASEGKTTAKTISLPPAQTSTGSSSLAKDLLDLSQSPTPRPEPATTIATSFGPTLSLKASLEGRPDNNQATKLFVGIVEGNLSTNPTFLLSFTVDLASDGTYNNLSLAGLSTGTEYTALLKGSAQIATSSAFIMSPAVSNLNDGQAINLLTGDLNEDNVVNSADYNIVLKAFGATSTSANWNELADFNKDGVINLFDLNIVSKNLNQIGASGAWTSPIPKNATSSASLNTPSIGSPADSAQGYWMWIPK